MKAILRKIRISPKKANLVAGMVRGKMVEDALNLLKFTPKKGAKILYKVVHSAAYNAKNNFKQSLEDLMITRILVTKGPTYKRSLPISRGRTHPIRKRTSHITVEVGLPEGKEVPKKEEKKSALEAEKKVVKKDEKAKKTSAKSGSTSDEKKKTEKKLAEKK